MILKNIRKDCGICVNNHVRAEGATAAGGIPDGPYHKTEPPNSTGPKVPYILLDVIMVHLIEHLLNVTLMVHT